MLLSNDIKDSPVVQGQTIGYVGSTEYATGPHLDYRINRNGRWINPINFVAEPLKLTERAKIEFAEVVENYDGKLTISAQYADAFKYAPIP